MAPVLYVGRESFRTICLRRSTVFGSPLFLRKAHPVQFSKLDLTDRSEVAFDMRPVNGITYIENMREFLLCAANCREQDHSISDCHPLHAWDQSYTKTRSSIVREGRRAECGEV